ncbi:MAG: MBOAT family O-acyltransferase [Limisphaerales bacterium]
MSFTSPVFLVFLAVVYLLYWRLKLKGQNALIFGASLFFYGWWDWRFLGLLFFTATIDYLVALRLMQVEGETIRKRWLAVSVVSNLAVLGFFKYFNFFADSLREGLKTLGMSGNLPMLEIILPLGISFYTFQALSYTLDVYRKELPAVRDFVQYMCFITFFPHMVAGPIQQATHFLVQFGRERTFRWNESVDGARQMLWGFYKKMVVADNLAPLVEAAYGEPGSASGVQLLWATYFFAFQIYCDFSGYTDIAIGCAKLFDFQLSRNFAYPYFATSIPEFWRRWHIALSDWFRRYLYIPLGGNRVSKAFWYRNLLIVFLVSGLWHGANWTFIIWGLLHGVFFVGALMLTKERRVAHDLKFEYEQPWWARAWKIFVTFHLVCVAWVFFRAESVGDAWAILGRIGGAIMRGELAGPDTTRQLPWIALLLIVEWFARNQEHGFGRLPLPRPVRWGVYYGLVLVILYVTPLSHVPFIYFQF